MEGQEKRKLQGIIVEINGNQGNFNMDWVLGMLRNC